MERGRTERSHCRQGPTVGPVGDSPTRNKLFIYFTYNIYFSEYQPRGNSLATQESYLTMEEPDRHHFDQPIKVQSPVMK